ncbi:MAG TPA: hypothetical protein V6C58_23220 [Allocoleopsis sp.]
MKIEDLADWSPNFCIKRMGMPTERDQIRGANQTRLLKLRQDMIFRHINDEHIKKLVNQINEYESKKEELTLLQKLIRERIEMHLKLTEDTEYMNYVDSNCTHTVAFENYLWRNKKEDPRKEDL